MDDHEAEPDRHLGIFPMPRVLRLVRYVVTKWRYTRGLAWSKSVVLRRDGHRCGYCQAPATTVDHIHPRSRGGRNTYQNTISACCSCNQRKADLTPTEAGMELKLPTVPTWSSMAQR